MNQYRRDSLVWLNLNNLAFASDSLGLLARRGIWEAKAFDGVDLQGFLGSCFWSRLKPLKPQHQRWPSSFLGRERKKRKTLSSMCAWSGPSQDGPRNFLFRSLCTYSAYHDHHERDHVDIMSSEIMCLTLNVILNVILRTGDILLWMIDALQSLPHECNSTLVIVVCKVRW